MLNRFTVTFNEDIDPTSVTLATASLSGPNGSIAPIAVNVIDARHFEFEFAAQTEAGTYVFTVVPNVTDIAGNLMDQDGDGVLGEIAEDVFTATTEIENASPNLTSLVVNSRRGGKVRVAGNFTDGDVGDVHLVNVDWGDGTTSVARVKQGAGIGSFRGKHRYRSGGIFDVTVTVTDDHGHSSTVVQSVTVAGISFENGTLRIIGTDRNDHVAVSRIGKHFYRISASFLPHGHRDVRASDVAWIHFDMRNGNDRVVLKGRIDAEVDFDGGDGRDRLIHRGKRHGNDLAFLQRPDG